MLKIDPNDRPTIEEVMDDPWFNAPTKRRRPPASTPSKRLSPTVSAPTKRRHPPAASADTDEDVEAFIKATIEMLAPVSSCDEESIDCASDDLGDLL